ncbi:glutamine synthetase family protein [Bosea sp. (in: a-proteobacteria)]|uniref:glutamine synthetase family protein n=1 Tax=Bosea sp. (in: a-proteobacteria) TaxID=1871050 RepID=UPI003B3AE08D
MSENDLSPAARGGRLNLQGLEAQVRGGAIDTVIVCMTDLQGRLIGKRLTGRFFLETQAGPQLFCDYLLATDMEMSLVPGYAAASWERGYGDFSLVPDLATLRRVPWLPGTAIVLCDVADREGRDLEHSPRQILKRQLSRLAALGYRANMAAELEFYLFDDSFSEARRKEYRGITPSSWYPEDGHVFQTSKDEPFIRVIRNMMEAADIPIEGSKAEWSPGQQEINLQYAEALEMADRLVLYKNGCKELAHQAGKSISFMAKVDPSLAGNSFHMHLSLDRAESGTPAFYDADEPSGMSPVMRHALAGAMNNASAATYFWAPNINSYRRFRPGTFAPTHLAWSHDNRTASFRVIGHGPSLRFECRIPGADVNPYLAFAALLAGAIDGVETRAELRPAQSGDGYQSSGASTIPLSLHDALQALDQSSALREALGDHAVDHYMRCGRRELEEFAAAVTDWEKIRLFERG